MPIIKIAEFKAKCLAILDEVKRTGIPVLVTRNGRPVAELVPHRTRPPKGPSGVWKGLVTIKGEIVSPIDRKWEALARNPPEKRARQRRMLELHGTGGVRRGYAYKRVRSAD